MAHKRRLALSLQENEELAETVRTFPFLYDKSKKYIRTKMLFRTPEKKLQISWTLLKTVFYFE